MVNTRKIIISTLIFISILCTWTRLSRNMSVWNVFLFLVETTVKSIFLAESLLKSKAVLTVLETKTYVIERKLPYSYHLKTWFLDLNRMLTNKWLRVWFTFFKTCPVQWQYICIYLLNTLWSIIIEKHTLNFRPCRDKVTIIFNELRSESNFICHDLNEYKLVVIL